MRSFSGVHPDHLGEFDSLYSRLRDFYRNRLRKTTPDRDERGGDLAEKRLQAVGISHLSSETFWAHLKTVPRGNVLQEVARAVKKTETAPGPLIVEAMLLMSQASETPRDLMGALQVSLIGVEEDLQQVIRRGEVPEDDRGSWEEVAGDLRTVIRLLWDKSVMPSKIVPFLKVKP